MSRKLYTLLTFVLILSFSLTACGAPATQATQAATLAATAAQAPTEAPAATQAPTATEAPVPARR